MVDPPASEPATPPLPTSLRAEIEAWFARRGVPQLIDDYTTERRMDARAGPFVLAWIVSGSIIWWGTRPDWSLIRNLVGALVVLLTMALGVAFLRWVRGEVMWWEDRRLGVLETFSLGLFIAVPAALIEGSWQVGITSGLNALLGIGVIYVVIGLGVGALAWWSVGRLRHEVTRIAQLLGRTLPVLLILVLFLLFAAELWEAADLLSTGEVWAAIFLLMAVATLLVITAFRSEIHVIESLSWEEMVPLVAGSPAESLAAAVPGGTPQTLRFLQRLNLVILVLIGQLIQSAFVALVVTGFLVLFGLLVVPASLQERWIGAEVTSLTSFELLDETRILSSELVTVAVLLGGVVGLYFTGLAITDSSYRTAHFDRLLHEVRQLVAARAFYVAAVRGRDESGPGASAVRDGVNEDLRPRQGSNLRHPV